MFYGLHRCDHFRIVNRTLFSIRSNLYKEWKLKEFKKKNQFNVNKLNRTKISNIKHYKVIIII